MLCSTCKEKFPKISKLITHWKSNVCNPWKQVIELKRSGQERDADSLIAKITGTYKPMTEEAKEKLKTYYEEHKEEILAKAKLKRMTQQAMERNIANKSKNIRRKKT